MQKIIPYRETSPQDC